MLPSRHRAPPNEKTTPGIFIDSYLFITKYKIFPTKSPSINFIVVVRQHRGNFNSANLLAVRFYLKNIPSVNLTSHAWVAVLKNRFLLTVRQSKTVTNHSTFIVQNTRIPMTIYFSKKSQNHALLSHSSTALSTDFNFIFYTNAQHLYHCSVRPYRDSSANGVTVVIPAKRIISLFEPRNWKISISLCTLNLHSTIHGWLYHVYM